MAFVVSSGALQQIEKPVPAYPPYAMRLTNDNYRDYASLWRSQPELRTVVDFLARNIAQLGIHVFERVSDVDRERLTEHPLAALLARPNNSTTRYRLINALVHDMCIFDTGYWLKVKGDSGQPVALRRIRPQRVRVEGDNWVEADQYTIVGNKGTMSVDAASIVHFRGYNPTDDRLGDSPIESLRNVLAEEWAANVYREQLWRNGARMAGYLKRPIEAPEWDDKTRRRFRDQWQAQWTSDSPKAGGTPILEDGMDFVSAATSPRDAQYVESRKLTREEVARSFHVPLPMVGILDHATFSNIREQHKQLYMDCLGPWLEQLQEEIELQLLPDLDKSSTVYVEFNIADKLRGSFEEQAAQLQTAVGGPWMTRNEARARVNLPQIDGGDELIVPLNVSTSGDAPPPAAEGDGETAPVEETGDAEDTGQAGRRIVHKRRQIKARAPESHTEKARKGLSRFFARQGQVVLSNVGADKARHFEVKATAADVFDQARWNDELAADLLRINSLLATSAALDAMDQMGLDPSDFDPAIMSAWLAENASAKAKAINTTTFNAIAAALIATDEDPEISIKRLFEVYADARALQLAVSLTSSMSGFGTVEAGRHGGGPGTTKTWVTGNNPRASHKAMNGETVPIESTFSNGARWPADTAALGADDIAGCNCDVVITTP
jgi:HK97 family phage portal protein